MRARGGWSVCAALALLATTRSATATPPITAPWQPATQTAVADTSAENVARLASSAGSSTTNTGVLAGLGLFAAGYATGSGGILLAGYGVWAAGVVAGPALGWHRAGYPGRGTVSALVRVGVLAGAIAVPLASRDTRTSEFGALVVATAGLTGLVVATFEAYGECDGIARYVRKHGPGRAGLSLAPVSTPSGAPGLALVARFD
jgi:hypothetical protein